MYTGSRFSSGFLLRVFFIYLPDSLYSSGSPQPLRQQKHLSTYNIPLYLLLPAVLGQRRKGVRAAWPGQRPPNSASLRACVSKSLFIYSPYQSAAAHHLISPFYLGIHEQASPLFPSIVSPRLSLFYLHFLAALHIFNTTSTVPTAFWLLLYH